MRRYGSLISINPSASTYTIVRQETTFVLNKKNTLTTSMYYFE